MFGLSTSHLIILGFIALLFGSRRLPELGASMGNAIRAFKAATEGGHSPFESQSQQQPLQIGQAQPQPQKPALSPSAQSAQELKASIVVDEEVKKVT
jgi:sec-independent protein translocase protein TatA